MVRRFIKVTWQCLPSDQDENFNNNSAIIDASEALQFFSQCEVCLIELPAESLWGGNVSGRNTSRNDLHPLLTVNIGILSSRLLLTMDVSGIFVPLWKLIKDKGWGGRGYFCDAALERENRQAVKPLLRAQRCSRSNAAKRGWAEELVKKWSSLACEI